jgi:hypothetical protein
LDSSQTVDVYATDPGELCFSLNHTSPVLAACFSLDGSRVFTVTPDGQGYVWQTASAKPITGCSFQDDFSEPTEPWTPYYGKEAAKFSYSYNGSLRIEVESGPMNGRSMVTLALPPGQPRLYSDLTMSVDILDWDAKARGLEVGMTFRTRTKDDRNERLTIGGYLALGHRDFVGTGSLVIFTGYPLDRIPWDADPKKDYRLVFAMVGKESHLLLFELDNPSEPVASLTVPVRPVYDRGYPSLWVFVEWQQQAYYVTMDNFSITGIRP